jgi:hypothetical protein
VNHLELHLEWRRIFLFFFCFFIRFRPFKLCKECSVVYIPSIFGAIFSTRQPVRRKSGQVGYRLEKGPHPVTP